jgi:hypothetical protein
MVFVVVVALAAATAYFAALKQSNARYAEELATRENAWQQEKAELESALAEAKAAARLNHAPLAPATVPTPAATADLAAAKATPAEIIARLRTLKPGPGQTSLRRQIIHDIEELITAGPVALPAIREFLARNEDVDFDSIAKGGVPNEFLMPPSLRFGLFEAAKRIGGEEAEKILAITMNGTGRGIEVAWLARALQEIAPDKYRDAALAVARGLLARPALANPASPLDRNERAELFNVLAMFGDASYVATAQTQLVQADGGVDRSALKYLQQTLGSQAVPIAAQLYNDPRLTDPAKKEPLARVALNFVGLDAKANEFYNKAINDMNLPKDDRRQLIEDLNQDGFMDRKNLSARDLPLIDTRIAIVEQLAPSATDPVNLAAFKEAYKDLQKMRERVINPPPPKQKP